MRQSSHDAPDDLGLTALEHFRAMVESMGVKRFSSNIDLSTRQVNRILAGAQPNPVYRLIRCLQSCETDVGNHVLDFICQEMGGFFVREEGELDAASSNAVKECAEAIAAISDGEINEIAEMEVREAICALVALLQIVKGRRAADADGQASHHAPGRSNAAQSRR